MDVGVEFRFAHIHARDYDGVGIDHSCIPVLLRFGALPTLPFGARRNGCDRPTKLTDGAVLQGKSGAASPCWLGEGPALSRSGARPKRRGRSLGLWSGAVAAAARARPTLPAAVLVLFQLGELSQRPPKVATVAHAVHAVGTAQVRRVARRDPDLYAHWQFMYERAGQEVPYEGGLSRTVLRVPKVGTRSGDSTRTRLAP